jgi:hypothetical protein
MKKARKTTKGKKITTPKKLAKRTNKKAIGAKTLQLENLDKLLLKLTPYEKVRANLKRGQKRLEEERRFALQLGSQILDKAKDVREQLVKHYKPRTKK